MIFAASQLAEPNRSSVIHQTRQSANQPRLHNVWWLSRYSLFQHVFASTTSVSCIEIILMALARNQLAKYRRERRNQRSPLQFQCGSCQIPEETRPELMLHFYEVLIEHTHWLRWTRQWSKVFRTHSITPMTTVKILEATWFLGTTFKQFCETNLSSDHSSILLAVEWPCRKVC